MADDDGNEEPLVIDPVPPEAPEVGPQPAALGDVYLINYGAAQRYDASHRGRRDRMIWNRSPHAPRVSHPNVILWRDADNVTTVDGTSRRPTWVTDPQRQPVWVRVDQGVAHLADRYTYLRFDDDRFHAAVPIELLHDRHPRHGRSKRIGHLFDDPPNPAAPALAKEIVRALARTGRNIQHRSLYRAWEAEERRRAVDPGAEPES